MPLVGGASACARIWTRATTVPAPPPLGATLGIDPFVRPRAAPRLAVTAELDLAPLPLDHGAPVVSIEPLGATLAGGLDVRLGSDRGRAFRAFGLGGVVCSVVETNGHCEPPPEPRFMCGNVVHRERVIELDDGGVDEEWLMSGAIELVQRTDGNVVVGRLETPIPGWTSRHFDERGVVWIEAELGGEIGAIRTAAFSLPLDGGAFPESRPLATVDRDTSFGVECAVGADGERLAIAVGSDLVLVGHGGEWAAVRTETASDEYERGPWSCVAGELRRVDRSGDHSHFRSLVCAVDGCGVSTLDATAKLADAPTAVAGHLGGAVVVAANDPAGALHVAVSLGGAFAVGPTVTTTSHGSLGILQTASAMVREGAFYVPVRSHADIGLLRIDVTGRVESIRFELDAPEAR